MRYQLPFERMAKPGEQIDREIARLFFHPIDFAESMEHARQNGLGVAFAAVVNEKGRIVDAVIHKAPMDGKKRPLRYEAP